MNRIKWLDSARGLGIILVVIGHALGGLIDSKLGANQDVFRQLFFAIYTFHMPLFFLLSGLMVTKRLEKGQGIFLRGLIPSIIWPYFLWSVIQFSIIYALGSLVNRPAESYWPVILSLPWSTVSQFWFLYALFWMHILSVLLIPRLGREGFVLLALALKSLALILICRCL
jgi:fucose 4-O-acetylase-like acetyltransferase